MRRCRLGSPEWMNALKEHCFDHVDRLYRDAGVKDGMSAAEVRRRIDAEYARREKAADELEAQASFWRAVQRRNERP